MIISIIFFNRSKGSNFFNSSILNSGILFFSKIIQKAENKILYTDNIQKKLVIPKKKENESKENKNEETKKDEKNDEKKEENKKIKRRPNKKNKKNIGNKDEYDGSCAIFKCENELCDAVYTYNFSSNSFSKKEPHGDIFHEIRKDAPGYYQQNIEILKEKLYITDIQLVKVDE